jgi:hemin uptake protein HemP
VTQAAGLEQPSACSSQLDASEPAGQPARQSAPLDSAALLRGGRSVEIRHNGEVYRLQATRLGKLILTK